MGVLDILKPGKVAYSRAINDVMSHIRAVELKNDDTQKALNTAFSSSLREVNSEKYLGTIKNADVKTLLQCVPAKRSVDIVSGAVGVYPLRLIDQRTGDEIEDENVFHFLNRLNYLLSDLMFYQITEGRAHLYINPKGEVREWEFKVLPTSAVELRIDGKNREFVYVDEDGMDKPLNAKNSLTFYEPHYIPPLMVAQGVIQTYQAMYKANARYFGSALILSRALWQVNATSKEEFEATKKAVKERTKGVDNAYEALVVDKSKISISDLAESNKDMEYTEGINQIIREIAMAFGIPSVLLHDHRRSTYNNVHEARYEFYQTEVTKKVRRLTEQATRGAREFLNSIVPLTYDIDAVAISFNPLSAGAIQKQITNKDEADALLKLAGRPVLTVNELRKIHGLPELEDGENLGPGSATLSATISANDLRQLQGLPPLEPIPEPEPPAPAPAPKGGKEQIVGTDDVTEMTAEEYWRVFDQRLTKAENGFESVISSVLRQFRPAIAKALSKLSDDGDNLSANQVLDSNLLLDRLLKIDPRMEADVAEREARAHARETRQISKQATRVGLSINGEDLALQRRELWARGLQKETTERIGKALAKGLEGKLPIRDISKVVLNEYDDIRKFEAVRIARTESTYLSNMAHQDVYEQFDIEGKEWIATADGRTRDDHLDANGQVVGISNPFNVGGEQLEHPGQGSAANAINCRCTTRAVNLPEN